jgi:putative ABC transport system substrate-binding protein
MTINTRSRNFIAQVISTVAICVSITLSSSAQEAGHMRRVGVVAGASEQAMKASLNALRGKLNELGWVEGRNLILDVHFVAGDYQRLSAEVAALINSNADVIVAQGSPAVSIIRKQSATVPVVFTQVADPVALGIVKSLAHPDGYSTGFTNYEFAVGGKWLELLRQIDPQLKHVALIANPTNENTVPFSEIIETIGKSLAIEVTRVSARNGADIESAISANSQQPGGGIIFFPDALPLINRDLIIRLATQYQMPGIYPFRDFPVNGGLISYGLNFADVSRQAAGYVDRILRGAKVGDLPVQAPTKLELVINVKTAKSLGLEVPSTLLVSADAVIE